MQRWNPLLYICTLFATTLHSDGAKFKVDPIIRAALPIFVTELFEFLQQ